MTILEREFEEVDFWLNQQYTYNHLSQAYIKIRQTRDGRRQSVGAKSNSLIAVQTRQLMQNQLFKLQCFQLGRLFIMFFQFQLEAEVLNKGVEKLDLTFCFHTYFAVPDVEECALYNFRGESFQSTRSRFQLQALIFLVLLLSTLLRSIIGDKLNISIELKIVSPEIRTRGCQVRRANASSVPCSLPDLLLNILAISLIFILAAFRVTKVVPEPRSLGMICDNFAF